MGLLDNLFSGGQSNDPAEDQWKRAALEELLARAHGMPAPSNDPAQPRPDINELTFAPAGRRGVIPRPVPFPGPDTPVPATPEPSASAAPMPMAPPMSPTPWETTTTPERTVTDRPVASTPYAPPPPKPEVGGGSSIPGAGGISSGSVERKPRETNMWDRVSAFTRGSATGGLVGGFADAMNLDNTKADARSREDATTRALAAKIGDPEYARAIASDPELMKAMIPMLFGPKATGVAETAFATESGKNQAEQFQKLRAGATQARDHLARIGEASRALDTYNAGSTLGTGPGGPYELMMRKALRSMNVGSADTVSAGELANTFQSQMALLMRSPDGGLGMPGAMSEGDRKFLVDAQAGIDKSPEGNRKLIEIETKLAERKVQLAGLAEEYVKAKKSLDGFENFVTDWTRKNPIFASAPSASGGAPAPGSVVKGYRFKGGNPASRDSWESAS